MIGEMMAFLTPGRIYSFIQLCSLTVVWGRISAVIIPQRTQSSKQQPVIQVACASVEAGDEHGHTVEGWLAWWVERPAVGAAF
jgi:hypothetical protein